jgi:hypothetical protein
LVTDPTPPGLISVTSSRLARIISLSRLFRSTGNPSTRPYAAFAGEFSVSKSQLGISWGLPPQTHLYNKCVAARHRPYCTAHTKSLRLNYSYRSATIGSTRDAQRAGIYPAATVTAAKMSAERQQPAGRAGSAQRVGPRSSVWPLGSTAGRVPRRSRQ